MGGAGAGGRGPRVRARRPPPTLTQTNAPSSPWCCPPPSCREQVCVDWVCRGDCARGGGQVLLPPQRLGRRHRRRHLLRHGRRQAGLRRERSMHAYTAPILPRAGAPLRGPPPALPRKHPLLIPTHPPLTLAALSRWWPLPSPTLLHPPLRTRRAAPRPPHLPLETTHLPALTERAAPHRCCTLPRPALAPPPPHTQAHTHAHRHASAWYHARAPCFGKASRGTRGGGAGMWVVNV